MTNENLKRGIAMVTIAAATTAAAVALVAGPAAAHDHQMLTPGQGDPVLEPEPFHGDDPSNGAILNNPNVSATQYESWGLHPLHHFLHLGPSADNRNITVVRL